MKVFKEMFRAPAFGGSHARKNMSESGGQRARLRLPLAPSVGGGGPPGENSVLRIGLCLQFMLAIFLM